MNEEIVNPCARAEKLLPEYWRGGLSADNRTWVERHLESCGDCAELATLWQELGQLPEAEPDPLQRRRFDRMLAAYQTDHRPSLPLRGSWAGWMRPVPVALALVLLVAGFGGGWWLRGNTRPPIPDQTTEISALRDQVQATTQLVVLSLLRQQSANDRLQGVSYSRRLGQSNPQILQALLHSLQYDPSPDVRLGALDALQNAGSGSHVDPVLMRGLVESFQYQTSPLVQVALVDSFLELRPPAAHPLLQKISSNSAYSPEVRQRAAWGLSHWY
jgi:hypothetical protein